MIRLGRNILPCICLVYAMTLMAAEVIHASFKQKILNRDSAATGPVTLVSDGEFDRDYRSVCTGFRLSMHTKPGALSCLSLSILGIMIDSISPGMPLCFSRRCERISLSLSN